MCLDLAPLNLYDGYEDVSIHGNMTGNVTNMETNLIQQMINQNYQ